ncbi:hypothetical protein TCAL_12719 [Tigriopus californicus]|uniref:Uncharacterized protein n=2 Tax=Tigriopus californicus TaxID=6832 RepID=A0A553PTP9_TIGCA|nr:uncharacterized protein LOC131892445 isoform X2 [Tigriopus californicus]TRY81034.1 hypothetical protein TCAL_12719 [Tigriopus californicus]
MPEQDEEELLWASSATGERFPVQVDTNHPMWRAFLESGSLSPSQFFRAFLAPNSYFHSPTPWRSHRRLAAKVSELLDSFRPGSYSYRPFERVSQPRGGPTWSRRHRALQNPSPPPQPHGEVTSEQAVPFNVPHSPFSTRFQDLDEVRRRVYVDLGRPRPFYRRRPSINSLSNNGEETTASGFVTPATLEDLVKINLVRSLGLARLKEILTGQNFSLSLPKSVKERMLTFNCGDFEEVSETDVGLSSLDLRAHPASYKVRCVHDDRDYLAIFATSEVDKHMSNLWREYGVWMGSQCPNVVPILGLAADPLTENVFFILGELPQSLSDQGLHVTTFFEHLREEFQDHGLPLDLLKGECIFWNPQDQRTVFQNPVLYSRFRNRLRNNGIIFQTNMMRVLDRAARHIANVLQEA